MANFLGLSDIVGNIIEEVLNTVLDIIFDFIKDFLEGFAHLFFSALQYAWKFLNSLTKVTR